MFRHLKAHAKWMSPLVLAVVVTGIHCAAPRVAAAQAGAAKSKSSAPPPAPRGTSAATAAPRDAKAGSKSASQAGDAASREQTLKSPEWQETLRQFDGWLSEQALYDAEQVKQIRVRLEAGIKRMSVAQMNRFMPEMHAKLQVLQSDRAGEAQQYLAETLAVASPAYARKVRQQLPDVLSMNAAQIDQKLTAITAKRQTVSRMQKSFESARQRQVASNEAQTQARLLEQRQQAADRASAMSSGSPSNNFTPAADYYPYATDAFDTGYDGYAGVTWTIGSYRF